MQINTNLHTNYFYYVCSYHSLYRYISIQSVTYTFKTEDDIEYV